MDKDGLRIVFMGTPEFAVATLRRLVEDGYRVVAVVTQPDKPAGRHAELRSPAVKRYAEEVGIPVLQPVKMKDETFLSTLAAYAADVQVVVAFRMLPEVVWAMPRYGTFNVHASLLPQYRGAAPINWALINGETETGVTTFFIDHDIDTGRIIAQRRLAIADDADVEWLHDRLMMLGAELAEETLDEIVRTEGNIATIPQSYSEPLKTAPKIFNDTCEIDWRQTAKTIYDFIRGLSPVPGAWTKLCLGGDNTETTMVKIYKARKTEERCDMMTAGTVVAEHRRLLVTTADYFLELADVQMAGKRRMKTEELMNGLRL